jgi:aldehyde:ferredoxin oxidoreductase
LKLHWGDDAVVARLIPMIAHREGFGEVLAQGTQAMEKQFNVPGLGVQVNGLDPGLHDPRGISGMALVYLTSPRGACHNKSDFYFIASGHAFPEIGVELADPQANQRVAEEVVRHQDWRTFVDSSGSCLFVNSPIDDLVEMMSAATGREESVASLSRAGERIVALKRLINLKFGFSRADEVLPRLLMEPLREGNTNGFVPDVALMLDEYYRERGWDQATGRPSRAKLSELGLRDLIASQG